MADRENPKCPYCGNEMKAVILEERGIFFGEYQCRACQAYAPNAYGFKTFREALEAAYEAAMKRPLQKPMTVEEVHAKQNEIMYLEYAQNKLEEFPVLLTFFGAFYAEFEKYGGEGADFLIDEYNYKWRCWAENPTDAERKAAEWLE